MHRLAMRLPCRTLLLTMAFMVALAAPLAAGQIDTTYYTLNTGQWDAVGQALVPYLDEAFTVAQDVIGYDNSGRSKIQIEFYYEPSNTLGYTYPGQDTLYLNILNGDTFDDALLGDYGGTVAHETSHILFFNYTKLHERYSWMDDEYFGVVWISEALAYYTGSVLYSHGPRYTRDFLASELGQASNDGEIRHSWYYTGAAYQLGFYDSLDYVQLNSIGLFLAEQGAGIDSLRRLVRELKRTGNIEDSFYSVYGRETGQYDTNSGARLNTLYSEYLHFYLGHY